MALAYDGAIQRLIDAFGRLPGIGPKGAQRIAFYMLSAPEDEARFGRGHRRGQGQDPLL